MVPISALWIPIVLSAVIVFVASSVIYMVLKLHDKDYKKLPNEAKLLEAMRAEGVAPGHYVFPHAPSTKEMGTPEMIEKYKQGPVGLITVMPSGPPAMGKYLALWFVFSLVIGVFVAYLTGRTLGPGTHYLGVFRVAGVTGFLGYSGAEAINSIWKGQAWSLTFKSIAEGLLYGLLTAGVFGWLWPQ